jgi:hypothetical protein
LMIGPTCSSLHCLALVLVSTTSLRYSGVRLWIRFRTVALAR